MRSVAKLNYRYLLLSPRRWLLRLVTISVVCFAFSLLIKSHPSLESSTTSLKKALHLEKRQLVIQEGSPTIYGDWCTEAEYLDGEWLKREEEVTLARLGEIYQYTVSPLHKGYATLTTTLGHGSIQMHGAGSTSRKRTTRRTSRPLRPDPGNGAV